MELTAEQKQKIKEYLEQQGLSFKPLQDEMADHLICDLELRMREGYSFDKAWDDITGDISENHFPNIQHEVMETINKRFTWSQGLSFLALGLLLVSMLFKVLHLPLAGELLIVSFVFISAALLTTSLTGVFLNRGKQGAARVLSMIAGIIFLLIGYAFKLLHMPGADQFILVAVSVLIISMLLNTIHVYRNSSGHSNLMTFLHEKYTPGIERFFLILLFPIIGYNLIMILQEIQPANFILLVIMFGSGLQLIAMSWRTMEKDLRKRSPSTLAATIISSVCLTLPFLGPMVPFEVRVVVIVLFTVVSGWLAYTMEEKPIRVSSLIILFLVPVIFIGWALIRFDLIPTASHTIIFNIPVIVILTAGLLLCRKYGTMRAYMLLALGSYLFEYTM